MNNYLQILLTIIFTFVTFLASAQTEICNNKIDDDGDGMVDCFDGDCSTNNDCDGFFFGNAVSCSDEIEVSTFAIRQQWTSDNETATSHATPVVGDLDLNGIPEVISVNNRGTLDLFVLNGATGETIAAADIGFVPENTPVIADVNNDDAGDIIVAQDKGNNLALYNVNIDNGTLTLVWRERASRNMGVGTPGVADFDEDGDVEIYYRNEIMNASDGSILIAGDPGGNWVRKYISQPIAADIFDNGDCPDCAGLELITGNEIWSINEAAGTRQIVADLDDVIHDDIDANLNYYPAYEPGVSSNNFSSASIADYNLDGNLDVILSGKIGENIANAETAVFFWDVANQNVITWDDGKNFKNGTGRINIGDVDGDGRLNASFVMDQKLISLDENFNFHWDFSIDEGSSGYSGCSLFDFEGDGSTEIVYRSEELLLILRGEAGLSDVDRVRKSIACRSRTQEEYPVIADVDGDGNSEICVACYFDNTLSFDPYNNTQFSSIRVYESNGEAWMPARRVWNQHGYYNVNINDDLTIPKEIQDHAVKFANPGTCQYADGTPIPFDSKPLNTFLNQAPILNEQGCVEFVSPDINFVSVIRADPVACPDATTEVEFQLTNSGEADISGNLPVSYYSGDPTTPNATLLDTEVTLLENFQVGETMNVTQNVTALGGEYQLYVVINDNGSTPPISVPPPTATIPECNTANNIGSTAVTFLTFTLQTEVLSSNEKCADSYFADTNSDGIDEEIIIPDNGAARAYYRGTIPGSTGTFWLENFEDNSAGDTDDTGATSWSSDPGTITPDFYGVAEENGGKWFQARHTGDEDDEGVVTWTSETIDISGHTDISLFIDLYETGQLESSGRNRDFIRAEYILRNNSNTITASGTLDNGEHYGNFDYARASLTNINDAGQNNSSLTIIVSMHNSSSNESHYIDNIELQGTTTSTPAELTEGDGFEFYWYDAADTDYSDLLNNTSTFSQMDGGQYNVLGYFPATDCYSDTTTVTIPESTTTIYVWAYQEAPNTNCETPNGITAAFVYTSTQDGTFPATAANIPLDTLKTADGYTFTWFFEGDAATAIGTGDRLTNLNQTGYTVEVFQPSTGCTSSTNVDVTSTNTQITGVNKQIRNITECEGLGWLGANVGGSVSGFTFYWYDGTSIKPTPDFVGVLYYPLYDQGDFLLVVEDDISKCTSAPIPFRLEDESPAPTPTASLFTNNTSCVAGNGIVTADGDGSGTVAGYTFEWFLGDNTLASNALPGDAAPGAFLQNDNPYELGGLKEATYTVRVTEDATGCAETRTVRVNDAPTSLMINNTAINTDIIIGSCDPAELGVIDASGVVLDDITAISIGNINGNFEIPDISGYTFLPQEDLPGWSTTATDNEVELWNNNTFGVDAFEGEQFAEILANEIGALYFDLSTVPGSLFSWAFAHRGRANGRAPGRGPRDSLRVSIGNPSAVLRQGDFGTGTTAWEVYSGTYVVPDDQFVTRFQFESLDPGSVGNLIDSVSFVLLPYRFQLYEGTVASGDPDYMNVDGQFEDLDPGNYVLVVNDNLTGCAAVEIPITITREETAPVIPAPAITHDAHCKDDAGAIEISAASTPEPATYTYELFDGHSFATQIGPAQTAASGTSFTFDNIGPGDYRVRVTNDATLCTSFVDEIINDATVIPVFNTSYVLNHNTSCNPLNPNGQIIVSIDISGYNPNNYNFSWYEGSSVATGTPLPARSGVGANSLSDLSEGDFTVVAENISDGCETMELTIPLLDQPFVPDVVLTQDNPDTSCDVGNGQLSVLVNNDPNSSGSAPFYNNYTFEWYYNGTGPITAGSDLGNNSNVSFSGTNNSTISGLSGDLNEYSVTVMHNDLECSTTERIILTEDLNVPTITAVSASNTTCIPAAATGTITVTNDIPTATDRYYYYRSDGTLVTDAAPVSGSSTDNVSGLTDDTYKVVAETNLGCTSDTLTVVVGLTEPTLGAGESGLTNNTVCDPAGNDPGSPDANGAVTFTPTGGTGTNLFSFALRRRRGIPVANDGTTPVHEDVRYNNAGVTTTTVTGIPRGNYIMEITDETSGCSIDHPFAIRSVPETLRLNTTAIDASINPNTSCNPANYTGTATVNVADITNGAGTVLTDYSFFWAAAADPATAIDDDNVLDDDASGNTGVEEGDYILIVTDRITGCVSATANFTVPENSPVLTAGESGLTNNTVCDPAGNDPGSPDANGAVTFTPTGGTGTNLFSFALRRRRGIPVANDGTTPVHEDVRYNNAGVITTTVTGIPRGNYIMEITDETSGCSIDHPFAIRDEPETLRLNITAIDASINPNTSCNPANYTGTATVNVADITNGAGTALTDYSFSWAAAADPATEIDDDDVLDDDVSGNTGVEEGDYILIVTDRITGCVSAAANFTVPENSPSITPTTNVLQDNFSCDVAAPTGSATLTIAEGPNSNYSFAWYQGTSATGPVIDTDDQINNQLHGTYTVRITDNATSCTETASVVIGEFAPTLSIGSSSSGDHSDCYPANGDVTVTPNLTFTPAGPPTGFAAAYTYQWYFGTSATLGNELLEGMDPGNLSTPTNVTTNNVTGLAAGDYTVVITETQTGCVSGIETVTVADEVSPYKPTITFTSNIIPSSCDALNGRITAEITGMPAGPSASGGGVGFSFEWYEGAQNFATLATTGSGTELETGDNLVAAPGTTVTVTNTGGTGLGAETTLDAIISGLYTLVTIDNTTGCRFSDTYELGFAGQQVTTTLTVENVEECPDNGTARVGLADNIILTVSAASGTFTVGEPFTTTPGGASGTIASDRGLGEVQIALDGATVPVVGETITTLSGENATIDAVNNVGYATGPREFDDISQYLIYLYAGTGVPADRFAPYTYAGRSFPYTYDPATGEILDGNGDVLASSPGPVLNAGQEAEFPELPAGDYVAIAREILNPAFNLGSTSQCWTAASLDEEILDLAYEPIIQSRTVTNNTNCDITNGNGAISLTVIENPAENRNPPANRQPNGYRFTWLRVIDGTIIRNVDTPAETAIFTQTDLNAGDYTVTIQRLGGPGGTPNNCETSVTITVGNNPEQHLITGATISANDDCNPLDGSIVINDTDVTDNTNDYRFTWYTTYIADGDPGNVLLPDANVDGGLNGDINASSVSDLESGTYSVQAVHVTKTCITNVFEVEVDDNRLDPAFNVAQTARDIVCDDAAYTPTGQATLTITNGLPANPADYTISWFEDAAETQLLDGTTTGTVTTETLTSDNTIINGLPAGTYYVRIEDNVTPGDGCISVLQSVTIDQFNTTISVTNSDVTHNINCDPDNGRIQVNDISEDRPGIAPLTVSGGGIALTNYDFTWLEGDAATPVAVPSVTFLQSGGGAAANGGADASVAAGLPTGTYYLQIENNTTGCESELIEFSIEDNTAIPTFNVAQTARDIVCDDAAYTPTGQATLTITNGLPANPADYTISWFEDAAETQPLDGTPAGTVVSETLTANNTRIDGLPAGTYYVRIEDNVTPGDGCRSVRQSVTIDQFNTTISVTNSNVTHNTNCDPDNGRIQVNDISEDRPGGVTLSVSGGTVALTDYNFTWLEEDAATLVAVAAFPSVTFELSGGGAAANGGPDASVVDGLPTGTYYLQLENNTTGCESDLIEFFIDEEAEDPVINLELKTPDTFCAGNNRGDGTLAVNIFYDGAQIDNPTTNAAEYVVEWYRGTFRSRPAAGTGDASFLFDNQGNVGTVPNIGDAAQGADISVLSGLADGTYSVYVNKTGTEPYTGCNTIATFTIDPNDDYYFLAIDFIQSEVEADTICTGTPSGTITINDASITGNLNDFTIEVREGSVTGAHIGASPFTNNGSPEIRITGLTANEYFILGTHTGTGCRIPTGSVIIEDLQEAPIISLVSMEPDENCGTSAMVGELEVLVNGGEDHTNPRLSFQWVNDATGNNVSADFIGVTDTEATLTGVPGGDYSVTVTANLPTDTPPSTGCSATASYTILTEMPLPSIEDIDITPNNICDDDGDDTPAKTGSFQVLRVNYEGASAAPTAGEYTLTVFESNGTTQVAAPDDAANPVSNLDAGTYFASIERVSTSCASELLQFEIENNVLKPLIAIDLMTADPTCTAGFTSEGTLRATATLNDGSGPFDDTNTDYTFQWYDGAGTGTVLTGETSSTISNLDAGTYTVEVERVSTGCVTTQEFELPNVPVTVEILRADTVSSTNCNGNGSITVASVSRDNVTDYDFDYYDTDPTSGSPAPVFASTLGGAYTTAVPGTYWIIGTNTIVGCTTLPLQVVIGENFEYPTITLEEFDNPSNCDPDMPDGRLRVLANGEEEGTNYDFEWYFGDDTTNPLTSDDYTGGAELAGANTNEVTGVAAGTYTVEVTDLNTGCTITRTERLQDDNPNPIAISTSSSANTNCVSFNGSAAASVITFARGRRVNDYSFYWFTGDLAAVGTSPDTTAADFKGTLVQNLREGEYVVLAVDKTDLFCQSDATQVTVEDGTNRESIPYTLNINNVTVCFDQKNGGANLAFINPINATTTSIEWQDESGNKIGSSLTNSEFVIDSLEVGTYKMVLTDNNTLCTTNEIFDITDESMPPSAPTVQVINNRTNCVEANGSAVANVAGSTLNMFFEWFDPTNMNTPVFTGSSVSVLDSITYLVRATNLNTGCISPLTQVEILYQITDPVFSIEVESSLCLRTEDGVLNQFTGTAIVNFAEFNDASLSSYEWIFLETNEVVGMGTRLIDAIPGNYGVRFTADNGCEYYDEFELGIDLSIYNGVSANGDGKNDFFLIDCVDLFPNNNVKIFNRAGQKIYDVDAYNNTSTRFEGVSNVGGGGLVLPVGTYFYLIDLGTGGDLIQGYLELVR